MEHVSFCRNVAGLDGKWCRMTVVAAAGALFLLLTFAVTLYSYGG